MVFSASVLYPNDLDAKFDLEYYLNTHMPLVQEQWGPMGLISWEVVQYTMSLPGQPAPFSVAAHLVWKDEQSVKTAIASDAAKKVFGDVPNFSNKSPTFLQGNVVGSNGSKA